MLGPIISGELYAQAKKAIALADPTIFHDDGQYYLYGTGGRDGILVYQSADLEHWSVPEAAEDGYALHKKGAFGESGFWAPQVIKHQGKYKMLYTANEQIAIAESASPTGPFKQQEQRHLSGTSRQIDPFIFFDDGKAYLYFVRLDKGNRLYVAEMNEDLSDIRLETMKECLHAESPWEDTQQVEWPVVEGPTVVKRDGLYYLFYSANDYRNPDYAVGYAVSEHPKGPWKRNAENPLISRQTVGLAGSGHGDLFEDAAGRLWYVFHSHQSEQDVHPRKTVMIQLEYQGKDKGFRLAEEKARKLMLK